MWHDSHGIISIGLQSGGPENGGLTNLKIDLRRLFDQHCRSSCCPTVAHYALVLRVDGKFDKFGEEGIERIRRGKRDCDISADIIFPEVVWRGRSRNELRDYLARQVRAALQGCVERLRKDKETVDEPRFFREIDAAIAEFTKIDYDRDA